MVARSRLGQAFYDFQRRLKCELPGAKVVAEAVDPNTNASTERLG